MECVSLCGDIPCLCTLSASTIHWAILTSARFLFMETVPIMFPCYWIVHCISDWGTWPKPCTSMIAHFRPASLILHMVPPTFKSFPHLSMYPHKYFPPFHLSTKVIISSDTVTITQTSPHSTAHFLFNIDNSSHEEARQSTTMHWSILPSIDQWPLVHSTIHWSMNTGAFYHSLHTRRQLSQSGVFAVRSVEHYKDIQRNHNYPNRSLVTDNHPSVRAWFRYSKSFG